MANLLSQESLPVIVPPRGVLYYGSDEAFWRSINEVLEDTRRWLDGIKREAEFAAARWEDDGGSTV